MAEVGGVQVEAELLLLGHERIERVLGDQRLADLGDPRTKAPRVVQQLHEALRDRRHPGAGGLEVDPPVAAERGVLDGEENRLPFGGEVRRVQCGAPLLPGGRHERGRVASRRAHLLNVVEDGGGGDQREGGRRGEQNRRPKAPRAGHGVRWTAPVRGPAVVGQTTVGRTAVGRAAVGHAAVGLAAVGHAAVSRVDGIR